MWYNYKRFYSSLNYKTPAEIEIKITMKNNTNVA